jgi:hypothetical protein
VGLVIICTGQDLILAGIGVVIRMLIAKIISQEGRLSYNVTLRDWVVSHKVGEDCIS